MRTHLITAVLAAATLAGTAQAIDIKYEGVQSLGTYRTKLPTGQTQHVYAGRMHYSVTANGDSRFADGSSIFTFCTDLEQVVKNESRPYEFFSNADDHDGNHGIDDMPIVQDEAAPGMGLVKAQAVSALFQLHFAEATAGDALKASAFQLALWEIVYEPYTAEGEMGALDLSSGEGTFRVTSGNANARNLAQSWLDGISAMDLGSVSDLLIGFGSPDFQDQLTLMVIPLPAGVMMGLAGFGGMLVARRRLRA